MNIKEVIVV